MKLIGVDPGGKGAIAEIDVYERICRWMNLPYRDDGVIDSFYLKSCFDLGSAHYIHLEKVRAMKIWGVVNCFAFGRYFGMTQQLLSDYPYELVEPKKWQAVMHGRSDAALTAKERTKSAFVKMNPCFGQIKTSHEGLIDAFGIAYYAGKSNNVVMPNNYQFINVENESSCP